MKKQDYLLYIKLRRWAYRKTKNHKISLLKFWKPVGTRKWVFSTGSLLLANAIEVPVSIDSYVKVKGTASPYDGNDIYWTRRMKRFEAFSARKTKLIRKQDVKCAFCGGYFNQDDVLHEHHIIPLSVGGPNKLENLQLMHSYCHHRIHGVQKIRRENGKKQVIDL